MEIAMKSILSTLPASHPTPAPYYFDAMPRMAGTKIVSGHLATSTVEAEKDRAWYWDV